MAKKKKKTGIILSIIALVLIVATVAALQFGNKDESISVSVEKASQRTIVQTVSAVGSIQPETEVKISSEASGEIIELTVKEGDTVKKGTLLARIQPDIFQTQLDQSEAAAQASQDRIAGVVAELDRAKADYQRAQQLFEKKFISKEEFDRVTATLRTTESRLSETKRFYEQSLASLKQTRVSASRTVIYSPISGIVTSLSSEKGEKVVGTAQMQGTEMMKISDLSVINVIAEVTENDIVLVNIGDTARINVDALPNQQLRGVVYQIGNSALRSGVGTQEQVVNFEVRVRVLDSHPRLRPGMSCNVLIETDTRSNVLSVPLQSVTIRRNNQPSTEPEEETDETIVNEKEKAKDNQKRDKPQEIVYLKRGDKAVVREVKTGISDNGYIEILEGLQPNDEVISGSYRAITKELSDGALIKISKKQQ